MSTFLHTSFANLLTDKKTSSWQVLFTLIMLGFSPLSTKAQNGIACNDLVHKSLNTTCEAVIGPYDILEAPEYEEDEYYLEIRNQAGELLSNPVGSEQINEKLQITVSASGLSCWGYVLIEDKIAPEFADCTGGSLPDVEIDCDYDIDNLEDVVTPPIVTDNCSLFELDYEAEVESLDCSNGGDFIEIITITWIATNASMQSSTCTQTVRVRKGELADITMPPHFDGLDGREVLYCDDYPRGQAPGVDVTGLPSGVACANLQYIKNDITLPICGGSYKILRRFTFLDWCNGDDRLADQVIKVIDTFAITEPLKVDTIRLNTHPNNCRATLDTVPVPSMDFGCSEISFTLSYKIKNEHGVYIDNHITDGIFLNNDGVTYRIENLPQDTTWLFYHVKNSCDSTATISAKIIVEDKINPYAVCESHTVVTLQHDGWAEVNAKTFDDHSHDNCGPMRYEARRLTTNCPHQESDLVFGPSVHFCCTDAGKVIPVKFRVYDKHGNFAECLVSVKIKDDFSAGSMKCPDDITVPCGTDIDDTDNTNGVLTVNALCYTKTGYKDSKVNNDCGGGTVYRRWFAINGNDSTFACTQEITLVAPAWSPDDDTWPADTLLTCSDDFEGNIDDVKLPNLSCSNLLVSFEDVSFPNVDGVCLKILRTWKIIDWCNYKPNDPSTHNHKWVHEQVIKVKGTTGPSWVSCPDDKDVVATTDNCEGYIELKAQASNSCTMGQSIWYNYKVTLHKGKSNEQVKTGNGNDASGVYPTGRHLVEFWAEDGCNGIAKCSYYFTIKDNKAPTPTCFGRLSFSLGHDGEVEVWASDFSKEGADNCGNTHNLTWAFDKEGTTQNRTFNCDDLDQDGVFTEIEVKVYLIDEDGNYDFCTTHVRIVDSNNFCPDASGISADVSGAIVSEDGQGLIDFPVMLEKMDKSDMSTTMSSEDGGFAFENIDMYQNYTLSPMSEGDAREGVSTLDLVLIQQHILGMRNLDSPYKLIASDVNKSNTITASDLTMLRKVILGVYPEFKNNESWRFVRADHEFVEPAIPYQFPEYEEFYNLIFSENDMDFIAIKIGDVNGSAINKNLNNRSNELVVLNAHVTDTPSEVIWKFSPNEEVRMYGFQLAINFPINDLEFVDIYSGDISILADNVALDAQNGVISMSWSSSQLHSLSPDRELFSIRFEKQRKLRSYGILKISKDGLTSEVYNSDLEAIRLDISSEKVDENESYFELFQNEPNPFFESTLIGFRLPKEMDADVKLYDVSGKLLKTITGHFQKGMNEIKINKDDIPSVGVVYYQLHTDDYVASKKMIIMD